MYFEIHTHTHRDKERERVNHICVVYVIFSYRVIY